MNNTFGSLFSGGGGLDLGLERAGLKCTFQVENDRHCLTLLERHWPDVPKNEIRPCMGIVGGDPCPIRSSLANIYGTTKPDMSGYFLAMAARCKPRWVLRENVPASDVIDFVTALELLGYTCTIIEANSAAFTGQSRRREFVAGFDSEETSDRFVRAFSDAESDKGNGQKRCKVEAPLRCLDTRSGSCHRGHLYFYEGPEWGVRMLSHAERESLQGWPAGWTGGLPDSARARITGNGVTAPVAEWIGKRIMESFEF
jgi:DNA (cytosine-5)-methyltransferase 1